MKLYKISPDEKRVSGELGRIGVDEYAYRMADKGVRLNILVTDTAPYIANILKQEALASGMDAAVKRGVISCSVGASDVLLLGSISHYHRLCKRLLIQPFGLKKLADDIKNLIHLEKPDFFIARGRKIDISSPLVMGILNVTPDSFSDGGKYVESKSIKTRIDEIISQGADIIDIGGASSRPGAEYVDADTEIKRIDTALRYAVDKGAVVSIDTYNFETAEYALKLGSHIINDIKGLDSDDITRIAGEYKAAVCIMHMKGEPSNMQDDTIYRNIFCDIADFFEERILKAISFEVDRHSIILDVGFGFGKSKEQNYALLKYMKEFDIFGLPILAGLSRKSMIGSVCDRPTNERIAGTVAANSVAIMNGADIIRVHDISQGVDTVKVCGYIRKAFDND